MEPSAGTPRGMLILTRYPNEWLRIGDDIAVTVLSVQGNQVRLGIRAPSNVGVHREEIYRRIQVEKNAAADTLSARPPVIVRRARPLHRE